MKKTLAIITLSIFTGCASNIPLPTNVSPTTKVFNLNYDETWSRLIETLAKRNSSIKSLEKNSGIVSIEGSGNSESKLRNYAVCNGQDSFFLINKIIYGKSSIFVKKIEDNKTSVQITSDFILSGFDTLNKSITTGLCVSTGVFEYQIYDSIKN